MHVYLKQKAETDGGQEVPIRMRRVPLGVLSPNIDSNREVTQIRPKQWEKDAPDRNFMTENEWKSPVSTVKLSGKAPSALKPCRVKCLWQKEKSPLRYLPFKCRQTNQQRKRIEVKDRCKTDIDCRLDDVSARLDNLDSMYAMLMEDVPVTLEKLKWLDQSNDRRVNSLKEEKKLMRADPVTTRSSQQVSQSSRFNQQLEKQEIRKGEAVPSLLELVQHGTAEQVEETLNTDRTISESEIKEAVGWSLKQRLYEKSRLLLQDVCRLLVAAEGDNCVEAFPAYREGHCWEPLFVVLSKLNYQGEWDSFMGFDVYKRRYDFVSPEASLVIKSDLVQNNPLTIDDFQKAKHAINSAGLQKRHSKITVINACPYRSKRMGEVLEKGLCIVVHCWLKGFIPFIEEPFPEKIDGIPVDVREAYFQYGGKTKPRFNYQSSVNDQSLSDDTQSPTFTSDDSDVTSSSHMSSSSTSNSSSNEDMYNRTRMPPGATNYDQDVFMRSPDANIVEEVMDLDNSLELHIGTKSKDFNKSLRIGTCIGPSGGESSGTLGGFVRLKNGGIGALTCAHVTQGRELMSQPAEAELENASSARRCLFGSVCETIFDPGSLDRTGIDAAVIEIKDRLPVNGAFVWSRRETLKLAGFDPNSPPMFTEGNILSLDDLTPRKRHTSVIKAGAETGLTRGNLYLDGLYARISNREMRLPKSEQMVEFFNQMEIISLKGTDTYFFHLGDSGSLVFMPLNGSELYCIGMCVGCTSYDSCIVTPIEEIFNRSKTAVKFIDFSTF